MKRIAFALGLIASPAIAQDFDFTFDEDFAFDEVGFEVEEVAPLTVIPTFQLSANVGGSYLTLGGLTTSSYAAQINLANEHNLGTLGYLEWAGNLHVADLGGANDMTFSLDRVHVQNSAGSFSWKLGKYRIGWGEVEGAPVLDVLNSGLSFDSVGLSSDALPGQWFGGLDYFGDGYSVSGFIGVTPDVAHAVPTANSTDFEVGVQINIPVTDGKVSLYAAKLVPQTGIVDLSNGTSSATPYTLVGISANRAVGNALLEFDLAGKFGLERSTLAGLSTHDRIDAAIGVEYAASQTLQLSASLIAQHWLEQTQPYFTAGPLGPVATRQTDVTYMVGVSDSWLDGKMGVSANIGGAVDQSTSFAAVSLSYTVSDQLKLSATAVMLSATADSVLAPLDGMQQFGLTATFYY